MFSFLFLPLLVGLGVWQLGRAEEKHTLQELLTQQQDLPPVQWADDMPTDVADSAHLYRQVIMSGQFDRQKSWLLDNRIWQGRIGYEVIVPFHLAHGGTILVNRGWIAGTGYRDRLPKIPPVGSAGSVTGQLVKPSRNVLLAPQQQGADWPQTILQIDTEHMQQAVKGQLLPWVLQIDPQHSAALSVNWQNVNMPASKHLGYAWQWFTMALALLVLSIFANSNLGQVLSKTNKKS